MILMYTAYKQSTVIHYCILLKQVNGNIDESTAQIVFKNKMKKICMEIQFFIDRLQKKQSLQKHLVLGEKNKGCT